MQAQHLEIIEPLPTEMSALNFCNFSNNALTIKEGVPLEVWQGIGKFLKSTKRTVHFWIGDWIRYGHKAYGERYLEAMDITGLSYKTLRNMVVVCKAIEMSRRRDNLSFSHYIEVTALSPAKQDEWLRIAQEEQLSTKALRSKIKGKVDGQRVIDPLAVRTEALKEAMGRIALLDKEVERLKGHSVQCDNCHIWIRAFEPDEG